MAKGPLCAPTPSRPSLAATAIFLELNGYSLTAGNQEVLVFTRRVVVGPTELAAMATWLEAHSRPLELTLESPDGVPPPDARRPPQHLTLSSQVSGAGLAQEPARFADTASGLGLLALFFFV